jgi:hypothetical protein
MEAVVAPVLQEKAVPPEAVSVVVPPPQMVVLPAIAAVRLPLTFTVWVAVPEQFPLETVTVYVVFAVGVTVMEVVVAPVDHE